jgi:hypothetical protein
MFIHIKNIYIKLKQKKRNNKVKISNKVKKMKITLEIGLFITFISLVSVMLCCCLLQNNQQIVPTQNTVLERTRQQTIELQRRNENPVSTVEIIIDTNNDANDNISVIYTKNQRNNNSETIISV